MATFKINGKNFATQSGTGEATVHSDVVFPAGHIIQTKFANYVGQQTVGDGSGTGTTFVTIGTGSGSGSEHSLAMSVSSGNKILCMGTVNMSGSSRYGGIKVYSDSTQIGNGTTSGSRTSVTASSDRNDSETNADHIVFPVAFSFVHTPSDTSSYTYAVKVGNTYTAAAYTYINRTSTNGDGSYTHNGISTFILMDIAQ